MSNIIIKDVVKKFVSKNKEITALTKSSLNITSGEFVCLIGPSGCGKTTLLNMLAGFLAPSEGEIFIDEEKVSKPNSKRVTIFQEYGLLPWKSVLENVLFGLECIKVEKNKAKALATHYINLVGLTGNENRAVSELSGGMKQRVSIARALAVKPSVLFMDEPFGALDAFTRYKIQNELLKICKEDNPTVVFVTHDIDEAVYLADKVVVMEPSPGRIEDVINIQLSHPRDRTSIEFEEVRHQVFESFKKANDDSLKG
ncbi:ABC transporter [Arcobacter sp. F155]|uniref:ABC transporter ATP-binding protein n=1 Tax=Arcobacter sp. F155 TaxID=2044512 RepID=UPI00100B0B10|nr:ABC transporter ATP-binding protein [Arcobacter sp. F155]RXJ77969.1 ABC transporter [Arcobacter sp. F155]